MIELCVHFLFRNSINEEGLFRIPGSSARIKKLKSAINAWFVTLSSQSDLECLNAQAGSHRALHAIHDLVKGTVCQVLQDSTVSNINEPPSGQVVNMSVISGDDHPSLAGQTCSAAIPSSSPQVDQHNIEKCHTFFDAHTVAGLLKLYLRELPEPLLASDLYNQWINATIKISNNNTDDSRDEHVTTLKKIIQQLPKAHHDNLSHLIKFLHLLTCHSDSNKMTATNLAITMAPSLIRAPPISRTGPENDSLGEVADMQALTMQMSSIGMSASLHATLIEYLIRQAEQLFQGQAQFYVPELARKDSSPHLCNLEQDGSNEETLPKSMSPATLSLASTSSFSSGSISSSSLAEQITNAQSGLNENLTSTIDKDRVIGSNNSLSSNERPSSAQNRSDRFLSSAESQTAPPVPPAPTVRSHLRHASDSFFMASRRHPSTAQKAPAPPPPPQPNSSARVRHVSGKGENTNQEPQADSTAQEANKSVAATVPVSLRGTGSVPSNVISTNSNPNAIRPTVPPPSRPSATDDKGL